MYLREDIQEAKEARKKENVQSDLCFGFTVSGLGGVWQSRRLKQKERRKECKQQKEPFMK